MFDVLGNSLRSDMPSSFEFDLVTAMKPEGYI